MNEADTEKIVAIIDIIFTNTYDEKIIIGLREEVKVAQRLSLYPELE